MLSARAGDEARIEGLQAGADDYLVKPFAARELVARVRNHLEISRLRRSAELERDRLRALLGQVPAIINFLRGPELVVEYAHPLASKAFGGRNMLGKALADALPELYGQEVLELLRRVLETGESIESKERRVLLDAAASGQLRERYWNSVYLPVRDQAGQSEGVMTFDIDVTDQVLARQQIEQSEEKFRQLVSQVQAGIAQLDLSGRFTFANDRYLEIVGRSNEELLQLHMQFGEAGGVWDRDRLSQLLSNLVANACQHGMPAMPVLIQVDGSHADSVQLEVRNGGTIPPALLPSVFEPLRQAGGVHEKRDGSSGLGLGLYITQQIALAHSGTIGVESEEDQGTRFVVVLPRWPSHDAERVFDGGGISRLAASHGNFSGKREDDSPTN